jgi:hypothetical protein
MEPWPRSDILHARMEGLVKKGLLHARTTVMEWLVLDNEDALAPPNGYIVSFIPFHERGLTTPPQWDSTHLSLHGVVRGVPGDRALLRALEVFLIC